MASLQDYQNNLKQYQDPALGGQNWNQLSVNMAPNLGTDYNAPSTAAQLQTGRDQMQFRQDWLGSLSPSQLAEFTSLDNSRFNAATRKSQIEFVMAALGGGIGGALAGGAAGAAGGAGAIDAAGAAGGATAFPVASTGGGWAFADIAGGAAAGASTAVPAETGVFAGAEGGGATTSAGFFGPGGAGTLANSAGGTGAAADVGAGSSTATSGFFGPGGAGTAANNAGGFTAGSGDAGSALSALGGWQGVGSLVNTAGSLYGSLKGSNTLSNLGKGTPAQQTANSQLNTLLQDPSSITKMPGYAAGLQAVERTGAAQGYLGSGNMMVGLEQYGQNFYNDTLKTLSGIGQANAAVNAEYTIGGMQLFGQGMNSLGGYLAKFGGSLPDLFSALGIGG